MDCNTSNHKHYGYGSRNLFTNNYIMKETITKIIVNIVTLSIIGLMFWFLMTN
jgi:hypothetical protein